MFLDEARIHVTSGKGGDGAVHFRREKYVPRGGPDGGDGGRGGDVILVVSSHLNTLNKFRRNQHFKAEDGKRGGGSNKTGADGDDIVIPVPPGTIVRDGDSGDLLGDLTEVGQQLVVCQGGRGGRGNARFATSRKHAPRMGEKGAPGQERWLSLELRLIADAGIIGLPNAGKSTLLASVTNAQPKIADYPFTTLHPNLGVAELDTDAVLVLADIPGLIEGAHEGVGLGFAFLRHIQRTRVLIHLIDGQSDDPLADYSQINSELALFDPALGEKPQVVAINKMDLPHVQERWPNVEAAFAEKGIEVYAISGVAHTGVRDLLWRVYHILQDLGPVEMEDEDLPVYRPEPEVEAFTIEREEEGIWRIHGGQIERAAQMTYWEYDEAVRRFQFLLTRLGIEAALREAGAETGDTVRIGEYELEWVD
ncbi:MAG: GTPase ObgE [Anaerolineales bacterium]